MEKNYKDLIATLIKKHPKYSQYEVLYDDILADVYEHSKTVFEAIDNDDVIESYLNKIIATSMVVVPKKKNFITRKSKKIELPNFNTSTQKNESINDAYVENVNIENLEPDFSASETSDFENTVEIDDRTVLEENLELTLVEEINDSDSEEEFEYLEVPDEQCETLIDNNNEQNECETVHDVEVSVDKSLVDKMINSVASEVEQTDEELLNEQINSVDNLESDYEELEELEVLEDDETDYLSETVTNEPDEIEELDTLEEQEDSTSDILETEELQEDDTSILVDEAEESELLELTEEGSEVDFSEDVPDTEGLESLELSVEVSEDEIIENVSKDEVLAEDKGVDNLDDSIIKNEDFIDLYKKFAFEPKAVEYDSDRICAELVNANLKNPDKQILEICELKFYQGKTVREISSILSIPVNSILDTLSDIIGIIKD